ncbi:MAG: hypothetical protein K0R82_1007 [Flavipsychrobacter sp.]|jgi:2-polyprenyl-3-methyl-5-hydroxy-6-metoxy-1,4-benzoquinol methylase|nr:hypothetical protein [Flavipsychrobacter sp.]
MNMLKKIFKPLYERYQYVMNKANREEVDALYKLLYNKVHDLDRALPLAATQTIDAFNFQWDKLKDGEAMLSDKWFRDNVTNIITDSETMIRPEWFKGKSVLDCGCGGGRWSYGLAKLGANITAVDINDSAIAATREAIRDIDVQKEFVQVPLEQLSTKLLTDKKFDLVWSWGVLHHCPSFTEAFNEIIKYVKDGGVIYLYLYGREFVSYEEDINLFKLRVRYNTLSTWAEKEQFLVDRANGDRTKIHQNHDIYSPLLNRRLDFDYVKELLEKNGFTDVQRTVNHANLHIRARKIPVNHSDDAYITNTVAEPWFMKYN